MKANTILCPQFLLSTLPGIPFKFPRLSPRFLFRKSTVLFYQPANQGVPVVKENGDFRRTQESNPGSSDYASDVLPLHRTTANPLLTKTAFIHNYTHTHTYTLRSSDVFISSDVFVTVPHSEVLDFVLPMSSER